MSIFHYFIFLFNFIFIFQINAQTLWETTVDSTSSNSSPKCIDLTGDGILDIVIGGGLEFEDNNYGVIAFDGQDGQFLWTVPTFNQIFTSPIFQDINQDGTDDVFIGGRGSIFYAIDGKKGDLIWFFSPENQSLCPVDTGWYNFYTPQFIPDQNNDGLKDILCANGGYILAEADDTLRPSGHLVVLSASDGELLAKAAMPDNRETYMSPLVYDFNKDGEQEILFGSGGETIGGALWETQVSDLMLNDLSNALAIHESDSNGYIAPPSLVDLNMDGIPDIITSNYEGRVAAINGMNNDLIWEYKLGNSEIITNPCIGQFTDDTIPDVFVTFSMGYWDKYDHFIRMALDGTNGEILFSDTIYNFEIFSFIACDLNGDNKDEVIHFNQTVATNSVTHQVRAYDIYNQKIIELTDTKQGYNLSSTPWIGDLNQDGMLNLIYAYSKENTAFSSSFLTLCRLDLAVPLSGKIAWGGYLGTNSDGLYGNSIIITHSETIGQNDDTDLNIYYDRNLKTITIFNRKQQPKNRLLYIYNVNGQIIMKYEINSPYHQIDISWLASGTYFYTLLSYDKLHSNKIGMFTFVH